MKHKLLILILTLCTITTFAQADKDEQEEKRAANKDKVDFNAFHHQMLTLKEYGEERKKIPELQKANKTTVKIVAVVDSASDEDGKRLTGYIREDIGDNSTNIYEVTYDRLAKKIISVKPTGEATDEDQDETASKQSSKHARSKKKKDNDDENDDDDTPKKKKRKDDNE